ncbi:hypothetical protein SAMN06265219_11564 [Gracilimonas mengyeensis]|uniref:Uncharacterized protein n=1 Tax=Gracilimonas mengyeensis TaxID=1302730 RepID=A0A521F561_9BACT|nr:hypothetical protein SAMN06265219_11564 [Gracilimonas mengyeensis]
MLTAYSNHVSLFRLLLTTDLVQAYRLDRVTIHSDLPDLLSLERGKIIAKEKLVNRAVT